MAEKRRDLDISKKLTPDDSEINRYLNQINLIPLISIEEEVLLVQEIKKGSIEARNRLCSANLRFVVSVAKQYINNKCLSLGDLINEGNLGLIKAAEKFDETRGFKFISYAVFWVRASIDYAITNHSRLVRLPANRVIELSEIDRQTQKFIKINGRHPDVLELFELVEIKEETILNLVDFGDVLSIDNILDNQKTKIETIPDSVDAVESIENKLVLERLREHLSVFLEVLTERENFILKKSFGLFGEELISDPEIGEELCICKTRVQQIRNSAINKLKDYPGVNFLKPYWS